MRYQRNYFGVPNQRRSAFDVWKLLCKK